MYNRYNSSCITCLEYRQPKYEQTIRLYLPYLVLNYTNVKFKHDVLKLVI